MQIAAKPFTLQLPTATLPNQVSRTTLLPPSGNQFRQNRNRPTMQMERIQKVAKQIQSSWEATTQMAKPGVHFGSGFARTAVDSMLTCAVNQHVKHPHTKHVLNQLSKTAGLAAQISILKPGAFTLAMGAIIGLGGSASHTIKSLARLLGHVYLVKALIAVAQGNFAAANSLVASVCGTFAGKKFGQLIQHLQAVQHAPGAAAHAVSISETQRSKAALKYPALRQVLLAIHKKDVQLGQAIDHYLHPNFILKAVLPGEQLQKVQPALNARVSIG